MRSKAPLAMMEQMVMILVFALAAALCLQAFVQSDQMSKESEERDRALAEAQSAAEVIQYTGGDFQRAAAILNASVWQEDVFSINYGRDWSRSEPVQDGGTFAVYEFGYILGVTRQESGVPGLGKASVWVQEDETGEDLVRFDVCWQEVSGDG